MKKLISFRKKIASFLIKAKIQHRYADQSDHTTSSGTFSSTPPHVIDKKHHCISHAHISRNALNVLHKLNESGYEAYLVGGGVRDLLLDAKPKDFDVSTSAFPEKIRQLFRNSRLIGKRFRLAHVFFGREIIEVSTFRKSHPEHSHPDASLSKIGLLVRDNVYGNLKEDALRRDFTVNALYYDIRNCSVIDYVNGMADLKKRIIRILGDPQIRYTEDPVRMLRSLRFAAKLNFTLDEATAAPIHQLKTLLTHVPPARLFIEILKLFYCGQAVQAFALTREYGIFHLLFPQTEHVLLNHPDKRSYLQFIQQGGHNTDARIKQNLSLNPGFLFAVLLWPALKNQTDITIQQGTKPYLAFEKSIREVLCHQLKTVAIPKRYTIITREIWTLQYLMEKRSHRKTDWALQHPRFRAAYDFLLLRHCAGEQYLQLIIEKWKPLKEPLDSAIPAKKA